MKIASQVWLHIATALHVHLVPFKMDFSSNATTVALADTEHTARAWHVTQHVIIS